jgi:ATP-binding cassette subfamily C (CFTR/MRP) protein 1
MAGGSVWLKHWSYVNGKNGTNPRIGYYIGIYFALGVGSAALVVVQTLILWIFCSIEVSIPTDLRIMHYSGS